MMRPAIGAASPLVARASNREAELYWPAGLRRLLVFFTVLVFTVIIT